jgi:uncharacterized membrane protein (DUF485 family)
LLRHREATGTPPERESVVTAGEPDGVAGAEVPGGPSQPSAPQPSLPEQAVSEQAAPQQAGSDQPPPVPPRVLRSDVYRQVHEGEEFQAIRRRYRGFVFPACAVFLLWYLLYIVAAVTLPGLMARPVAGPFNVAWLLGLLQFGTTFLITWLYARHARDHRDRAALGLRWETQDRLR